VGYPNGISDAVNNVPVCRRGITATPAYLNFEERTEFLIDAAIYPGSSGSPVFIFNQSGWTDRSGQTLMGGLRIMLVGIVYATAQHSVEGELKIVPAPTDRTMAISKIPNNIGVCIKASRILDFEPILTQRGLIVAPEGYVIRSQYKL
jgi:hypothetical protein